jgi:hypothetical protein
LAVDHNHKLYGYNTIHLRLGAMFRRRISVTLLDISMLNLSHLFRPVAHWALTSQRVNSQAILIRHRKTSAKTAATDPRWADATATPRAEGGGKPS